MDGGPPNVAAYGKRPSDKVSGYTNDGHARAAYLLITVPSPSGHTQWLTGTVVLVYTQQRGDNGHFTPTPDIRRGTLIHENLSETAKPRAA